MVDAICELSGLPREVVEEDVRRILLQFEEADILTWTGVAMPAREAEGPRRSDRRRAGRRGGRSTTRRPTELHRLNPTATIVFGLCDGTATMAEMSAEIAEAFGVPIEQVEPQVRTLVRQLRRAKLLAYVPNRTEGTPEEP